MKGIYLTEEGKAEIEAKIAELSNRGKDIIEQRKTLYSKYKNTHLLFEIMSSKMSSNSQAYSIVLTERRFFEKILSSATILPVEKSWSEFGLNSRKVSIDTVEDFKSKKYPNGVIISK